MNFRHLSLAIILGLTIGMISFASAQKYDFNDGTLQGWTMKGAFDENGNGPFSNNFVLSWTNLVNRPAPNPGSNQGALKMSVSGGAGVSGGTGPWWIMELHSPDLSNHSGWQNAKGFSIEIVDNMTVSTGDTLYAYLWVTVYDYDQTKERYFSSGTAQKITYSGNFDSYAIWTHFSFDWSTIPAFPTNYQIREIHVNIWGDIYELYNGQIAIDEVTAIGAGTPPSITVDVPNGGEEWLVGSEQQILWTSENYSDPVLIRYSVDDGGSFMPITDQTENDGVFDWIVPNTPSTNCQVLVGSILAEIPYDISDATFSIITESGAAGLTVTNTNDSGPGSLRDAIDQANNQSGMDTIFFAIPVVGDAGYDPDVGVWTIQPATSLPTITDDGLLIDGHSQAAFIGEDRNPNGPEIQLNGSTAGSNVDGLNVTASGVEIYGLTINRFEGAGIAMWGVEGGKISGCYIGTDFAGVDAASNTTGIALMQGTIGVQVVSSDELCNLISGNTDWGIVINNSSNNLVSGNLIGLNRDITGVIGNEKLGIIIENKGENNEVVENHIGGSDRGVYISDSNGNTIARNLIGTNGTWDMGLSNHNDGVHILEGSQSNLISENIIWYNEGNGVYVYGEQTIHNTITRNSIARNDGWGIENDSGGNTELAPPDILSVIEVEISGIANPNQNIEVFADENNQGRIFLGSTTTDESGNFVLALPEPLPLSYITATSTDAEGNTSEFSPPFNVTAVEERTDVQIPAEFDLSQNYPNPFNPTTKVKFVLSKSEIVKIEVFNTLSQKIETLLNKSMPAGYHEIEFNAHNLSSGIYFYRIEAGEYQDVKKMILIK